ncbi:hypothetical protein FRC12_000435 [Ceratobasidium sp. 428]|nr:hypothetical protein FRC12_000435 [Ceratobasidium sp. 428]
MVRGGCKAWHKKKRACTKLVSDGTPSPESSTIVNPLSWAEEVKQAQGDNGVDGLFDFENWVNPDWLWSAYLSAPTQTVLNSEEKSDSINVKAFIYKVKGNYVCSDGKYANILNTLRSETLPTNTPSQTLGAGLSHTRASHKLTLEEIEDMDAPSIAHASSASDSMWSVAGKGKKKAVSEKKKKKHTKAPELGVEVDELKCSSNKDKERGACRHSSGRYNILDVERTRPTLKYGITWIPCYPTNH